MVTKNKKQSKKHERRTSIDPALLGAARRRRAKQGPGLGGGREKGATVDPELFGAAQRIKKAKQKKAPGSISLGTTGQDEPKIRPDAKLVAKAPEESKKPDVDTKPAAVPQKDEAYETFVKDKFRKDHPDFYNEEGVFIGGSLPSGVDSVRHTDLGSGAATDYKGAGLDWNLYQAMRGPDPNKRIVNLSESDFIKLYYAEKEEDKLFQEAAKEHNMAAALSAIPFASTAYSWPNMSPKWRMASLALDSLDILLITKGVKFLPTGKGKSKALEAAEAHENFIINNLKAYDDALNIPATKSVKTATVKAIDARLAYADALAVLEEVKAQGRYPTTVSGTIGREPISEAAYKAKLQKAAEDVDAAAAEYETLHNTLVERINDSKGLYNDGGELAELGRVSKPASAAESLTDTKRYIEGFIDQYPGIQKASSALDDKFSDVRKNVGFYKADGGPIAGMTTGAINDSVNDVLLGFKDLRAANRSQAQILKGRLNNTIQDLETTRIMTPSEQKAITTRIKELELQIQSLDSFNARELQKMRSLLGEVVETYPKDRTKWTPAMARIEASQKAIDKDLKRTVKEMEVIWDAKSGGGGPGGGGGGISAPPKSPAGTQIKPDTAIPKIDSGTTIKTALPSPTVAEIYGPSTIEGVPYTVAQTTVLPEVEQERVTPFRRYPIYEPDTADDLPAVPGIDVPAKPPPGRSVPRTLPADDDFIRFDPVEPDAQPLRAPDVPNVKPQQPGKDPSKDPGKDPGKTPGKDTDKDPGKDTDKDTDKDPGKDTDKDPGKDTDKDPGKDTDKDPSKDPTKDPSKDPGKTPGKDPVIQTTEITEQQRHFMPAPFPQPQPQLEKKPAVDRDTPRTKKSRTDQYSRNPRIRKKETGTKFRLPDGSKMKPGQYPKEVEVPMGVVDIKANLTSGDIFYSARKTPSRKSPMSGFKVLSTTTEIPRPLDEPLGVFNMHVTPKDWTFSRRRTRL